VLIEFASGGFQMLLFTCHEHIVNIFQSAHVEVRPLSGRDSIAATTEIRPQIEAQPATETPARRRRRKPAESRPVAATSRASESMTPPPPMVHAAPVSQPDVDWSSGWWFDDAQDPVEIESIGEPPVESFETVGPDEQPPPANVPRERAPILSAHRRFTWESPEMYWNDRSEDAA
jgi:hypothetical protein